MVKTPAGKRRVPTPSDIDISPGRNRKNPEKMSKGWLTGKSTGKEFFAPVSQSNEAAYKIL